MHLRLFSLLLLLSLPAFADQAPNTLTDAEKAAGWQLLFDGQTTQGWHVFGGTDTKGSGWVAEDGELKLKRVDGKTAHKDIVTTVEYGDFELVWEWKCAIGGNSGLKYNLPDKTKGVGCEYQMLDDDKHPDGKIGDGLHRTASLYDVIAPPTDKTYHPGGEWNSSRIVVKGNHVEQYLNGGRTVEFDFGSEALKALVAKSKFKNTPGWGIKTTSPLLLQDHGDEVSVRNIKVLVPKP